MVYLAVCRAIYPYPAQNANELEIKEGDLLFILDKKNEEGEEDEWWKAKKKAADDEDEEPEGLIPNNYVEEAKPIATAKAVYEYSRQTEEELSFPEGAQLSVYDTTDPDWTLVGHNGEYGFVPANYIEVGASGAAAPAASAAPVAARPIPPPPAEEEEEEEEEEAPPPQPPRPGSMEVAAPAPTSPASGPAASLASILGGNRAPPAPVMPPRPDNVSPPPATRHVQFTPEPPEEIPPTMPTRPVQRSPPPPQETSPRSPARVMESPPVRSTSVRSPQIRDNTFDRMDIDRAQRPGGYHMYNISEMVSVMGKQKKMPVTLGINMATGIIFLSPEKKSDGPQQEWTADKLEHYSIEGKHVFLELVKPSKSLDLHAGAKDTANEIVAALGDLAGAVRGGGGFNEIVQAATSGSGHKRGHMLYDFMAQGSDEVDVAEGDEVLVLDDEKSEEWWKIRRLKNGKEGVVPSGYVEISRSSLPISSPPPASTSRSTVERNRHEDERATREAVKRDEERRRREAEKNKRDSGSASKDSKSKQKPNMARVRTWTDRSGTFKVEAQFVGLRDGKIHLHKVNGVKIAVPVDRMSTEDLDFVESVTGVSLDEDKPLSDLKRNGSRNQKSKERSGASVEPRAEYDWFDFFLACGVNPQLCERYSQAFSRDSMDESVQEDITPQLLRTLGLKEGDIIKVMKHLDGKYNRNAKGKGEEGTNGENGSLFAGPGGVLKNNTGKARPSPSNATNNVVDGEALKQGGKKEDRPPTPPQKDGKGGFEDNAWDVKPAKSEPAKAKSPSPPPAAAAAAPPPKPPPTGVNADLAGLSLLDTLLQPQVTHQDGKPTPTPTPAFAPPPSQQQQQQQQNLQPQPTGASPAFFQQLPPQQTGLVPQPTALHQPLGLGGGVRQRPQPPSQPQFNQQGQLIPPPPARPGSAPQQLSPQSTFQPPALQPQLTGAPNVFNPAANPAQSLADMQRMRLQAQMTAQPLQPQPTGFQANQYMAQQLQPQMTGYIQAQPTASPFGDQNRVHSPPQMTGYQPPLMAQQTGMNGGGMMAAMQPQMTGMNGFGGYNQGAPPPVPQIPQQYAQAGQSAPFQPQSQFGQAQQTGQPMNNGGNMNNMSNNNNQQQQQGNQGGLQPAAQPLMPQKTGPAPTISFGMNAVKKLTPQPTGRANLAKATAQNPFGF